MNIKILKDKINKRIIEINRILANKGITKKVTDKQWEGWLKYCEVNNFDEFTGILKKDK